MLFVELSVGTLARMDGSRGNVLVPSSEPWCQFLSGLLILNQPSYAVLLATVLALGWSTFGWGEARLKKIPPEGSIYPDKVGLCPG